MHLRKVAAMVAAVAVCASAQVGMAVDYIKVGAWNVENLGDRTPGQFPIAIAEHIELSGVEILCLSEIHVRDAAADRKNDILDTAFSLLNDSGSDWTYEVFPNRDPEDSSQLCGVAWNRKAVTRVGDAFQIGIRADSLWDRRPHAVKFRGADGRTDFVLIPVHMKSNYDGAQIGRSKRKKEATALVSQLDAVRSHFTEPSQETENDIIVLGDTNILDFDEAANEVFMDAGFRDLNSSDAPTFVRGTAPFDRIYVPMNEPETRYSRQYVLRATEAAEHEEYLSDHFLILTVVKILDDDDQ